MRPEDVVHGAPVWYRPSGANGGRFAATVAGKPYEHPASGDWCVRLEEIQGGGFTWSERGVIRAAELDRIDQRNPIEELRRIAGSLSGPDGAAVLAAVDETERLRAVGEDMYAALVAVHVELADPERHVQDALGNVGAFVSLPTHEMIREAIEAYDGGEGPPEPVNLAGFGDASRPTPTASWAFVETRPPAGPGQCPGCTLPWASHGTPPNLCPFRDPAEVAAYRLAAAGDPPHGPAELRGSEVAKDLGIGEQHRERLVARMAGNILPGLIDPALLLQEGTPEADEEAARYARKLAKAAVDLAERVCDEAGL